MRILLERLSSASFVFRQCGAYSRLFGAPSNVSERECDMSSQDDDANLGPQMVVTNWTLDAVSGLFLGLRIYCKLSRKRRLWWDDYLLIASWVGVFLLFFRLSSPVIFSFCSRPRRCHRASDPTPISPRTGPDPTPPIFTLLPPAPFRIRALSLSHSH